MFKPKLNMRHRIIQSMENEPPVDIRIPNNDGDQPPIEIKPPNDINANEVKLKIKTSLGLWDTVFQKNIEIKSMLSKILKHFGYAENGNYKLYIENDTNKPLSVDKRLSDYKLPDGTLILLVDQGNSA